MSASLPDVKIEVVSLTDTSTLMRGRASLPSSLAVEYAMSAKMLLQLDVRSKDHRLYLLEAVKEEPVVYVCSAEMERHCRVPK